MSLLDRCSALCLRLRDRPKRREFLSNPVQKMALQFTRDQIASTLQETEFFHGTGRYHYGHNGTSKYDGSSGVRTDSLRSLAERGLEPRKDLFSAMFTRTETPTTSLTRNRMYARVYASLFAEQGHRLRYEYGSRPFWWRYFLGKMFFDAMTDPAQYREQWRIRKLPKSRRLSGINPVVLWRSSFSDDDRYDRNWHRFMMQAQSTIPGNYPVIIGVRHGAVESVPLVNRSVRMYETRTACVISPEQWSYIEVPLDHFASTRRALTAVNPDLEIPVLPMELVELYMGEKPFGEITRVHPERNIAPTFLHS